MEKLELVHHLRNFLLIFDTAVSDLWIPSSKCTSSMARYVHSKYNSTKSSTFTKIGTPCTFYYGTSTIINGLLSQDNVQAGDLVVKNQAENGRTGADS